MPTLAISPVHRSKAGSSGEPANSGFIAAKPVHKLSNIQNVNHPGCQVSAATGILEHIDRLQRWLLACTSSSEQASLFGLQISESRLSVPRDAVRVVHRAKDVHQGGILRGETTCQRGHFRAAVSRRFAPPGTDDGGMPSYTTESLRNHQELGVHCERKEIKAYTSSRVRMVRRTMESSIVHSSSGRTKISVSTRGSHRDHHVPSHHETFSDETARPEQLDRHERSQRSAPQDNYENYPDAQQIRASGYTNRNPKEPETASLCMDQHTSNSPMHGITSTRSGNPDRCISKGLGFSDKSNLLQRDIRPINETSLNQCQRIANHLVCPPDSLTKEYRNPGSLRQFIGNSCAKKGGVNEIRTIFPGGVDMEQSNSLQLDTQHLSHSRNVQRHSGSIIQKHIPVNRMVSRRTRLSESTRTESAIGGRPIRNEAKQEASSLRISMSRPRGLCSKCANDTLGEMESSIPLSPDTYTFEGFVSSDPILLCECDTNHPGNAHKTVVHESSPAEDTVNTPRSPTPTSCSGQDSETTRDYQT